MHTIFIAFYTKDSPYEQIAKEKLIPSLERFNLNYEIIQTESQGNWYKNVAEKPKIILDYLVEYPFQYNVVILDVDAIIEKEPILFNEIPDKYDIAFHYLDWSIWYRYQNCNIKELLTGTMLFRNRPQVRELCKEWYSQAKETQQWEQKVLERIIGNYNLKIFELPIEYIYINTLPNGSKPRISDENVVIRHFQASRTWKRKIPILDILKKRDEERTKKSQN